jgi:hypothetical protein
MEALFPHKNSCPNMSLGGDARFDIKSVLFCCVDYCVNH